MPSGRVIGINSQIEAAGGQGNVGIGFAVPINTARDVADQLLESGEVEHAFLGITGADVTPEIADVLNLSADDGALVQDVVPDGPAADAGIEGGSAEVTIGGQPLTAGGDVITEVDGEDGRPAWTTSSPSVNEQAAGRRGRADPPAQGRGARPSASSWATARPTPARR